MKIKTLAFFFSLIIDFLLIPASVFSQEWKTFNKDNTNIPDNNILCIAIDNNGNKWFGTHEGLVQFDGISWKLYLSELDVNITNKTVNDLKFESVGNQSLLWVATESGIFLLDISNPESPIFRDTYKSENSPLIDNSVKKITVDPGHARWFGTYKGVSRFNENKWENYSTQNYWINNDKVVSLASGPDSMVYIGTEGGGVSRLKFEVDAVSGASTLDNTWTGADEPDKGKLTSNNIYSILIEQNEYQWFGTDEGVALHTSRNTKRDWKNYTVKDGLIDNLVQAICKENKNSIWFGTPKGVSKFDGLSWTNYTSEDGLANNNVHDIAIDNDGSIWFATEGGISVLTNSTAITAVENLLPLTINSYPNPFYFQTSMVFTLNTKMYVKINIYDINGQHVAALASELLAAGEHSFTWNRVSSSGNVVPKGVYLVQLTAGPQIKMNKTIIYY